MRSYQPPSRGHSGQIRKAIDELLTAKRPVIYTGGGVVQGNASALLTELAHLLGYPVTNTLMGLGGFPGDDPQFIGMLGMHGTYEANMAMHHADVILAIGARFDDRVTNNPAKFCPNSKVIHVDIDPATISKTIMAHIPIVGAVEPVLQEMLAQLKQLNVSKPNPEAIAAWWSQINEWRKVHGLKYENPSDGTMKPQQVVETLYKVTNGDAIITSDVGQHQMFGALYYKYKRPRQWINSGGLGTMGVGLPYAMAAKLAFPDQQVVCITGEASIQMCIQELSTCKQYGLNVKILCLNNRALGMVKQWQDMNYEGRHSSSYVESLPDFAKLMEAYGHVGIQINHADELESKLAEAMAINDKCVFINVMVDRSEHVYPMQVAGQSMRDMWISKGAHLMRHIISVLVENEAGALSRLVGLFSQRNYNIETLNVAPTEDPTLSRLTLTTYGDDHKIEQITKQLNKLVEVVKVVDLSEGSHIERELMLIKVKALGASRAEIKRTADIFRAQIVDVTPTTYTIQIAGTTEKLDGFIDALAENTILEVVRSGVSGIARGEKVLAI